MQSMELGFYAFAECCRTCSRIYISHDVLYLISMQAFPGFGAAVAIPTQLATMPLDLMLIQYMVLIQETLVVTCCYVGVAVHCAWDRISAC